MGIPTQRAANSSVCVVDCVRAFVYFFARSVPEYRNQGVVCKKGKYNKPTKTDKLRPIPVTKLIVHRVAPIPGSLIFR